MHSTCIGEASELCFNGCLPIPSSSALRNPKSSLVSVDFEVAMASTITSCSCSCFTNHESLLSLQESFSNFTTTFPHYTSTHQADTIRGSEYYHLADTNQVCLDYIGHGLFSYSQMQCSSQAASMIDASKLEGDISKRIMSFMNVSADDYTMIFTANEASAFKLLADSYPFQSNPRLLTVYDHDNEAAKIMIDSAKKRRSRIMSAEFMWPTLRIMSDKMRNKVTSKKNKKRNKGLFVFPLHSRVTGTRYSYLWMQLAQENGWHVLLDASALGPKEMETLGLSLFKPDFIICSFYKVFGDNPSGFGCLFVKKSSASVLDRASIASSIGIISLVPFKQHLEKEHDEEHETRGIIGIELGSSSGVISEHQKRNDTEERIEATKDTKGMQKTEETEISLSGDSLEFRGLDHADTLGLVLISARARYLTNWLVNALLSLRHPNPETGRHLVRIYGPKVSFKRAPALAFNMFDWKGDKIDPALVQKLAGRRNISLSCGVLSRHMCFLDKGSEKREKHRCGVSVVTAALGFLTNFEDVYRVWEFVSRFLDADFVEKESWRYSALNQQTVQV